MKKNNFYGIYKCPGNTQKLLFSYNLELNSDGTCEFIKKYDLCTIVGIGNWTIQKKYIIIEYAPKPTDFLSVLMCGSYMDGIDTIQICNANKLKLKKEKVILKKQ